MRRRRQTGVHESGNRLCEMEREDSRRELAQYVENRS